MRMPRIHLWWLIITAPYCGIVLAMSWGNLWNDIGIAGPVAVCVTPSIIASLRVRASRKSGVGILCCIGLVTGILTGAGLEILDLFMAHLRQDIRRLDDIDLVGGPVYAIIFLAVSGAFFGLIVGLLVGLVSSLVGWPVRRDSH